MANWTHALSTLARPIPRRRAASHLGMTLVLRGVDGYGLVISRFLVLVLKLGFLKDNVLVTLALLVMIFHGRLANLFIICVSHI